MTKGQEKALKLIEDSMNKKCNGLECKVVKNNIDLRLENIHLNRQVDLMAEVFYKKFKAELLLEYGFENEEQLKQYFEREVEECLKNIKLENM